MAEKIMGRGTWSFPTRERGLKLYEGKVMIDPVTSFPTRERGLKHSLFLRGFQNLHVVPYAGTWIETPVRASMCSSRAVVPYAGTWIETSVIPYR